MSQISKSQRGKKSRLSQTESEEVLTPKIVASAVKVILTLDYQKRPIKMADIKNGMPQKVSQKFHAQLWKEVKANLAELGMTLEDYNDGHSKCFLLVSQKPECKIMSKYASKEERADRTLLILILGYIFMKDGMVLEDELFRHLQALNILQDAPNPEPHDYFGDVKKKVQVQFIEQVYLTRAAVPGHDSIELRWGKRAELEVSQQAVLEFVCKVAYHGEVEPKQWVSQYERAQKTKDHENM